MATRLTDAVIFEDDGAGLARLERQLTAIVAEFPPGADTAGIALELTLDLELIQKLVEALRLARLTGQAVQ